MTDCDLKASLYLPNSTAGTTTLDQKVYREPKSLLTAKERQFTLGSKGYLMRLRWAVIRPYWTSDAAEEM